MTEAARPGRPLGEIDDAHRRVYDAAGFGSSRMSACGYSLGALYRPTWMDVPPMLYSGNPTQVKPGMMLFLRAILIDAPNNLAMSLGHTIRDHADWCRSAEPAHPGLPCVRVTTLPLNICCDKVMGGGEVRAVELH